MARIAPRRLLLTAAGAVALALGCALVTPHAAQLEAQAREDFAAGRVTEAIAAMRQVVAQRPDDPQARFVLGVMLLRTDHVAEAEVELARAVSLAPRDAKILAAHGLALRAQKRWKDAENALVRSLLFQPNEPSTIAALGELYRLSGNPEQCAARYEQFVWQFEQRDPKSLDETEQRALSTARHRARECDAAARVNGR